MHKKDTICNLNRKTSPFVEPNIEIRKHKKTCIQKIFILSITITQNKLWACLKTTVY